MVPYSTTAPGGRPPIPTCLKRTLLWNTASSAKAQVEDSNLPHLVSNTLVPATLLGGSAVVYSSVLKTPSALTPLSLLYMFLLAIQYSIQPRLTRKYLDKRTHKQTATLVEEVVKSSLAAALFCATPKTNQPINQQWSLQSSLVVAGIPAVLYAAQGVMTYSSQQHLDSVTFNGITQTKTLSAALFCYLLLQQNQSPIQLLALAGLLMSSFLFQGINPFTSRGDDKEKFHFAKGVLPCLGATAISGLAGALSQKGVQMTGVGGRDPFLYAMEVAGYSGICLLVSMMARHFATGSATLNFGKAKNWFAHWNCQTLWPVTVKAAGGILTVLVHKHAGSVAKGFSLMFGLVLSGILQTVLDGRDMSWHHVMGTLLVMLSGWAHFTHPPM